MGGGDKNGSEEASDRMAQLRSCQFFFGRAHVLIEDATAK